jgi:hypothetical protein
MSAWIAGSARGGRERSVICFSSTVKPSAIPAAAAAASAAAGSRRFAASQQPPVNANRGHLTHHAEAMTKSAVRGPQCAACSHSIAAPSHWAS